MKALLMALFASMTLAAFSSAPASTKRTETSAVTIADPYPCRQAFLVNLGTDTAVVEAQDCSGAPLQYTLAPGQYTSTPCVNIAHGINKLRGEWVVIDWMSYCQ